MLLMVQASALRIQTETSARGIIPSLEDLFSKDTTSGDILAATTMGGVCGGLGLLFGSTVPKKNGDLWAVASTAIGVLAGGYTGLQLSRTGILANLLYDTPWDDDMMCTEEEINETLFRFPTWLDCATKKDPTYKEPFIWSNSASPGTLSLFLMAVEDWNGAFSMCNGRKMKALMCKKLYIQSKYYSVRLYRRAKVEQLIKIIEDLGSESEMEGYRITHLEFLAHGNAFGQSYGYGSDGFLGCERSATSQFFG